MTGFRMLQHDTLDADLDAQRHFTHAFDMCEMHLYAKDSCLIKMHK